MKKVRIVHHRVLHPARAAWRLGLEAWRVIAVAAAALASGLVLAGADAQGDGAPPEWGARVEQLALQAAQAALGPRTDVKIEVQAGRLDPRLRLAPCARVDFYLPAGQRPWGSSRVGVRCLEGPSRWNVFLPLTVRVWAPAVEVAAALPAGTTLAPEHLRMGTADWALSDAPPATEIASLAGRQLARPLAAGDAIRDSDLKKRQWFAAGDTVQLVARGRGFSVSGEARAMSAGIEGQTARVRTDNGRLLSGVAVGPNRVEVSL